MGEAGNGSYCTDWILLSKSKNRASGVHLELHSANEKRLGKMSRKMIRPETLS